MEAASGFDAFQLISSTPVRAIVSDVRMANGSGIELLEAVKKHYPSVPMILVSGYHDFTEKDAKRMGAAGMLAKPFDTPELLSLLRSSLDAMPKPA